MVKLSHSQIIKCSASELDTRINYLSYRVYPLLVSFWVISAKEIKTFRIHFKGMVVPGNIK